MSSPVCTGCCRSTIKRGIPMRRNYPRWRNVFSCFFGILAVGVTLLPTLKYWGRQMDLTIFLHIKIARGRRTKRLFDEVVTASYDFYKKALSCYRIPTTHHHHLSWQFNPIWPVTSYSYFLHQKPRLENLKIFPLK